MLFACTSIVANLVCVDLFKGQFVPKKIVWMNLYCLSQGCRYSLTYKLLMEHLEPLFRDVLFRYLCYSDEDYRLFKDDPVDYVYQEYSRYRTLFGSHMLSEHRKLANGKTRHG